jgi:glucose/mannose transport system permease protein
MIMARSKLTTTSFLVLLPTWAVVIFLFVGTIIWSIILSFTSSRMFPVYKFVGLDQYHKLFGTDRWITSLQNITILAVLFLTGTLVIGFVMAAAIDRQIRYENAFRTIFLFPYSMSFVVTGLIWQWLMNPTLGIQAFAHGLGLTWFRFDWPVHGSTAIFAVLLAIIWHSSGLVMILMLAGLRGIDQEQWKAAQIDGIPVWRTYLSIILPQLGPSVATALTLMSMGVIRTFDVVVALTNGGPGNSSDVPAKFIMDNLFDRQNIGLGTAGSTIMLMVVAAIGVPLLYLRSHRARLARAAL